MRADTFYQTTTEQTVRLILATPTQYVKGLNGLTVFERNSLIAQQFEGALGNIGILSDNEGNPNRI